MSFPSPLSAAAAEARQRCGGAGTSSAALHVTGSLSTELVSIIIREGSKLRYYNATLSQPYNAINFLVRSYWQELVNSSLQVLQ